MPQLTRQDITELFYIAPIDNLRSILDRGLLSYDRATHIPHTTIAMESVQSLRKQKIVPVSRRRLHTYVNLFFNCRNAMMYSRKDQAGNLCVISINPTVLDTSGVIMTSQNAATYTAQFACYPDGLHMLDKDEVFARRWVAEDKSILVSRKTIMCAEVLVPDGVPAHFIQRIYCHDIMNRERVLGIAGTLGVEVKPDLFFRSEPDPYEGWFE